MSSLAGIVLGAPCLCVALTSALLLECISARPAGQDPGPTREGASQIVAALVQRQRMPVVLAMARLCTGRRAWMAAGLLLEMRRKQKLQVQTAQCLLMHCHAMAAAGGRKLRDYCATSAEAGDVLDTCTRLRCPHA